MSCRLYLPWSPLPGDACLSYIPQFVAKSESLTRSIPRSFLVKSLADFAAGLDVDLLLCPVRALRLYLLRARSLSPCRHRLFVSPRRHSRAMSKNAVSFFLREVKRGVIGYTPFYCGFLVILYSFYFLLFLFVLCVPLLTLGPPGGFLCMGDA